MVFINYPQSTFDTTQAFIDWLAEPNRTSAKKGNLKAYLNQHLDYPPENNPKCWYSEKELSEGELQIDHFRPENKSSILTENRINSIQKDLGFKLPFLNKGLISGYKWLSTEHKNFRIICQAINGKAGKTTFFPLYQSSEHLKANKFPWNPLDNKEIPLLLDPTNKDDCGWLWVDKTGALSPVHKNSIFPTDFATNSQNYLNHLSFQILKAIVSIHIYGLNRSALKVSRVNAMKQVFQDLGDMEDSLLIRDWNGIKKFQNRLISRLDFNQPFTLSARCALLQYEPSSKLTISWQATLMKKFKKNLIAGLQKKEHGFLTLPITFQSYLA